jgi:hypothetical protein
MIIQGLVIKNTTLVLNSVDDQIVGCDLTNVTFNIGVPVMFMGNVIVLKRNQKLKLGRPYRNEAGLMEPSARIESTRLTNCKNLAGGFDSNYIECKKEAEA